MIIPTSDRIVVQPIETGEQLQNGIYIPETAQEKPMKGKILAVGIGRTTDHNEVIPVQLKEGQTVLYGRYSGAEVTVNNEKFLIMRESDVLAVLA